MTTTTDIRLSVPGAITNRAAPRTDDLLARIRSRQPAGATEIPVERIFVWTATISNDTVDSFFTRMHPTTLQNYTQDLRAGVGWLDSHNVYRIPIGTSIDGTYHDGDPASVSGTFFLIRGTSPGGGAVSADDLATLIEGGIATQCSVGFSPGSFSCNLCDGDPFNWAIGSCVHIPGLKYRGDGYKQIATEGGTLAYANVMDGHLREVSVVYKAATSGAKVTGVLPLSKEKASRMLSAGHVGKDRVPVLTRMFGTIPPTHDARDDVRILNELDLYASNTPTYSGDPLSTFRTPRGGY